MNRGSQGREEFHHTLVSSIFTIVYLLEYRREKYWVLHIT